jgi:acetolactate synthase-1/2/3 large subunit
MDEVYGYQIAAEAIKREGVDTLFFLMGGPITPIAKACKDMGINIVDVRHEQAAAMMAHGWSRVTGKPGVCLSCSGPGTLNASTGIANAFVDGAPTVFIGGSSPLVRSGTYAFQDVDQVAAMRPITKWAGQVQQAERTAELVRTAFRKATGGKPGPVYLDLPWDVIYTKVDRNRVDHHPVPETLPGPQADPASVKEAADMLSRAERPVVIAGSGVLWSGAEGEMARLVEQTGLPLFTTPLARGIIPEDHRRSFIAARSMAFGEADVALVVGTRFNFILAFGRSPRFNPRAKMLRVDIDPEEMGHNRSVDVALVGDAKQVLKQLLGETAGRVSLGDDSPWIKALREKDAANKEELTPLLNSEKKPTHPLRLCKEIRDFMDRDSMLIVDGHEILNYARQSIPVYHPRHRLNSGPFGCIGVGLPFGIAAKLARPSRQVIVLTGDGSFGLNGFEVDTAIRHNLPIMVVISNNGGWTAGGEGRWDIPGRELGFSRYEKMVEAFGGYNEYVEDPEGIKPAMERAWASGRFSCINVITDQEARAVTQPFSSFKNVAGKTRDSSQTG